MLWQKLLGSHHKQYNATDDVPITVCALERFLSVMRAFMDSKCASDGERLTTSREVTQIRLCHIGIRR
jgi:hypothetical protein